MSRKASNKGPKRNVKCVPVKKRYFTEEQMADALRANHGGIYRTAHSLHISPQTVANYVKVYPDLRRVIKETKKLSFELVIGTAYERAIKGDPKFARYVLFGSPEGRAAGWSMSKVVTHQGTVNHNQKVEVQEISTEKAEQIIEMVRKNIELKKQWEAKQLQNEQSTQTEQAQSAPLPNGLKELTGPVEISDITDITDITDIIDVEVVEKEPLPKDQDYFPSPPNSIDGNEVEDKPSLP